MVITVAKQVLSFPNVYNLASMGVRIEHTVGGQNQDFLQNAFLMVTPAETWVKTKVKVAKSYAFVHRNLMVYMENLIKLNFLVNSVLFVI